MHYIGAPILHMVANVTMAGHANLVQKSRPNCSCAATFFRCALGARGSCSSDMAHDWVSVHAEPGFFFALPEFVLGPCSAYIQTRTSTRRSCPLRGLRFAACKGSISPCTFRPPVHMFYYVMDIAWACAAPGGSRAAKFLR